MKRRDFLKKSSINGNVPWRSVLPAPTTKLKPNNDRKGSYDALVKIRQILKDKGDYNELERLAMDEFFSLHVPG